MRCCVAVVVGPQSTDMLMQMLPTLFHVFPVARGPLNAHGTLLSVRDGCGRCLPITSDLQALQVLQGVHYSEDVREQDVAHHVLSQSMSMELNITNLFGGSCVVISAPIGHSMDSTCSTTFVRCVARASSLPMSPPASLTSVTFCPVSDGFPTYEKKLDQERTHFNFSRKKRHAQHCSDHRSVPLPFHYRRAHSENKVIRNT